MKKRQKSPVPLLISLLLIGSIAYGLWTWYDANVDRSGWSEKYGIRYYQDFHGNPVAGWLEIGDATYYFDDGGIPRTGWQQLEGETYYFQENGVMSTGWRTLEEKTYYFQETGIMHSGWLDLAEERYYLENGVLVCGWKDMDGGRYYFGDQGCMARGFTLIGESTYYFGDDGLMRRGTQSVGEQVYTFGEDGIMCTGWQETEEGRRYYYEDGPMARGWTEIGEKRYFFAANGLLHTGWLQEGEYSYYLHPEGHAAVGPTDIEGQRYYFSPKGVHIVLVNAKNRVPDYYKADLKTVTAWHRVDARCHEALTRMLEDCKNAGINYTFNSAYRSVGEQSGILEARTSEYMERYNTSYSAARQKALQTVAYPGTSEHHLGLAVDLLGEETIAWLGEHCWDYGFIVRYTEEKYGWTGIISEPWHFRYVGVEVAKDLRASGLCLEEYLGAEAVKPYALEDTE